MLKLQNGLKKHSGKISQPLMIALAIGVTLFAALGLLFAGKNKPESADEHGHGPAEGAEEHAEAGQEGEAGHEEGVALTAKQLAEQGIQLAKVEQGAVLSVNAYPAKLSVNTDQQAHVSPSFSGHVEAVYVELGQNVKKGQPLAALLVPELVDQQSNLRIEQSNLELAKQDYERERQLWSQGISAKQDYQKAYSSYKQAQIQVHAAQSRLSAYGAAASTQGRYILKAPISGVISKKDLVLGENVQLADQLFVIDQLDQLWLEFIVPNSEFSALAPNQDVEFKSLQTENVFKAVIQSLNTEADTQTGRLQIRAKVLSKASELRPNLMVNVMLQRKSEGQALRILKAAVQKVEGQDAVFIASAHGANIEFTAQPVKLGQSAGDSPWIEVISGLKQGQQYAASGSFLLKSELEKGEASHAH
ncbi:efflux RND transporter periplasmic adaptor subunit [Acinetobacter sp.]|uniref:efflux RND transporter periplasmic adaptor subunit n=1 Tax=Acinetobacter sp. TaxID=472 RepID=UPI002FCADB36